MHRGKPKEHLDDFNKLTVDLKSIDVKIEDEDQVIILLCFLPNSYENFIDNMMYGHEILTMEEVKVVLNSKELNKKVSESKSYGLTESLFARGRTKTRNQDRGRSKSRSKSKFRLRTFKCYQCNKEEHLIRDCPKRKGTEKEKIYDSGNAPVANDNEDILTVSEHDSGMDL